MGGGGNDAVKSTNINEIQILSAGYQKPAKTVKTIRGPLNRINELIFRINA